MSNFDQLYEVLADYQGKEDDQQFLSVLKGDIVRVINKNIEYAFVDKDGKIGKVPLQILREQSSNQEEIHNQIILALLPGQSILISETQLSDNNDSNVKITQESSTEEFQEQTNQNKTQNENIAELVDSLSEQQIKIPSGQDQTNEQISNQQNQPLSPTNESNNIIDTDQQSTISPKQQPKPEDPTNIPDISLIQCDICNKYVPFLQYLSHTNLHQTDQQQFLEVINRKLSASNNLIANNKSLPKDLVNLNVNQVLIADDNNDEQKIEIYLQTFNNQIPNRSESQIFYAFDLSWTVLLLKRYEIIDNNKQTEVYGIFLVLKNLDELGDGFSETFKYSIIVNSKKNVPLITEVTHTFSAQEQDQGSWSLLKPFHMQERNGYVQNDKLHVTIKIEKFQSQGFRIRRETSMIGILDVGSHDQLNSLIQCIFNIPLFRWLIFHMPIKMIDGVCVSQTYLDSTAEELQRLFSELQTSQDNVISKQLNYLLKKIQKDTNDQHDILTLSKIILDMLMEFLKKTSFRDSINHLFKGHLVNIIKCTDIDYESLTENVFFNLTIPVKGHPNIYSSFDQYTSTDILEDENAYNVEGKGKQRAEKSTKFVHLPPILQIQLMRWEYDIIFDKAVKVNDYFEFPKELNMNQYVINLPEQNEKQKKINKKDEKLKQIQKPANSLQSTSYQQVSTSSTVQSPPPKELQAQQENEIKKKNSKKIIKSQKQKFGWCYNRDKMQSDDEDNIYILHSVFVHSNVTGGDKYKVYIQPNLDGRWFLFDNEFVKQVNIAEAMNINFGRQQDQQLQANINNNNNIQLAHMLVYIKKSAIKHIFLDITEEDIPLYIRKSIVAQREAKNIITFKIFTDAGLVRRYNSALVAALKVNKQSKSKGEKLSQKQITKIASIALYKAMRSQSQKNISSQQMGDVDDQYLQWIDTPDSEEQHEEALNQCNKTHIFDVQGVDKIISVPKQTTLQQFREEIAAQTNIKSNSMRIWRLLQKEVNDDERNKNLTIKSLFSDDYEEIIDEEKSNPETKLEQVQDVDNNEEIISKEESEKEVVTQEQKDISIVGTNIEQTPSLNQPEQTIPFQHIKRIRYVNMMNKNNYTQKLYLLHNSIDTPFQLQKQYSINDDHIQMQQQQQYQHMFNPSDKQNEIKQKEEKEEVEPSNISNILPQSSVEQNELKLNVQLNKENISQTIIPLIEQEALQNEIIQSSNLSSLQDQKEISLMFQSKINYIFVEDVSIIPTSQLLPLHPLQTNEEKGKEEQQEKVKEQEKQEENKIISELDDDELLELALQQSLLENTSLDGIEQENEIEQEKEQEKEQNKDIENKDQIHIPPENPLQINYSTLQPIFPHQYPKFFIFVRIFDKLTHQFGLLGRISLQSDKSLLSSGIPQIFQLLIDLANQINSNNIEEQEKISKYELNDQNEFLSQIHLAFPSSLQMDYKSDESVITDGKKSLLLFQFSRKTGGTGIYIRNWDTSPKFNKIESSSQILIQFTPTKEEKQNDPYVNVVEWQLAKENIIHVQIVDWSQEKVSRNQHMKVILNRDDDYNTIVVAIAKQLNEYRQYNYDKRMKERIKGRNDRKQKREKKQKERLENGNIADQLELQNEKEEEEKDIKEELKDNQNLNIIISEANILLSREKANDKLVDVNPNCKMTAEMMIFPEAYQRVNFSELTGAEKYGRGYQYHHLIQFDKLTTDYQKQLFYEVIPVKVHTYFSSENFVNFTVFDPVQRPIYQERYFNYKKDGTIDDALQSVREMFVKMPPLQNPRNQTFKPYFNIQSTIVSDSSSQTSIQQSQIQTEEKSSSELDSQSDQHITQQDSSLQFPLCKIYRTHIPQTAKEWTQLVRLAYSLAQKPKKRIELFKQFGFINDQIQVQEQEYYEIKEDSNEININNKELEKDQEIKNEEKEKKSEQKIKEKQFLLQEELIPKEEIFQMNKNSLTVKQASQTQTSQSEVICILPLQAYLMKTKEINISEPKQNFVHLNLQSRGNQIHDSSSFSVKVDIVAKDVFFRCSEAAFIGGDLYGRIFDHQMEKYRNEIPKEGRDQIPVFYIDPRFLVRGVHRNTNIQQEKIALTYPKDSFTIKVREDDTSFDVILSILLARGMLMTLQEALKLNIWIEDVTNSVLPIWDVKQEPGTIFKQGIMILIGRHSPLDKTQNIVNCISVCGGSEIHDRNIILKELSNLSHIIYLFRGDYENMIPQQQKLKIFSEQIEEEGGIEEVEAQLSNKGFNGDISSAALKTKIVALLNLLKR